MAPDNVTFFDLPLETIQGIGNLLPSWDRKRLRLVCSQLNSAFEAEVLATLVISLDGTTSKSSTCGQLATLALQKTRAAQFARTLEINMALNFAPTLTKVLRRALVPAPQASSVSENEDEREILGYLGPAISSLKNLEVVVWVINAIDSNSSIPIAVIDALARLPHLQNVQLTLGTDTYPSLSLKKLSGLKKISISSGIDSPHWHYRSHIITGLAEAIAKSPQLVHLEIGIASGTSQQLRETPTLHDLLSKVPDGCPLRLTHLVLGGMCARIDSVTLPHLHSLVYLKLRNLSVPTPTHASGPQLYDRAQQYGSTASAIYSMLKQENIHLKHVITGDIDDVILDYLDSYSGLETLGIGPMDSDSVDESNDLGRRFYNSVLPKHINSIRVLEIRPYFEGGWCYDIVKIFPLLSECTELRSLSVALNSTPTVLSHETANTVESSHLLLDASDFKEDYVDLLSSLIDLSLVLPHLTEIKVFSAHTHRGAHSDRSIHCRHVTRCIENSLNKVILQGRRYPSRALNISVGMPPHEFMPRAFAQ